jgi:DNA polymerase elongation subunit (family B)
MWEQNVIKIVREAYMLSYSAKWLGGKHVTKGLCDYKGYEGGPDKEKELTTDLWKLFDEADILIAHNGDKFDIRKANALFYKYKLGTPSPYKTVDTMKVWNKNFATNSKSLRYIAQYADIEKKMEHEGFPLWEGCDQADPKAWKKMLKYNRQDVVVTEQLYLSLLPWITNHPPVGTDCPNCGKATILTIRSYMTRRGPKTRGQCACGFWREISLTK